MAFGTNVDAKGHARPRITLYNIFILMFVGFGSMSYGYTASIIGTTLGQPTFYAYFDLATRKGGTDLLSSMNGLFQTGGVIGTLLLPPIADKYGRKGALAASAIVLIISSSVLAGSTNIGEFLAFRFTAGMGTFSILAAVPIWMNEVVPEHLRGGLVDFHAVFLVLGYTVQGWVGYGFYFWKAGGNNTWRVPLALAVVWPFALLCGLYWVPESPRWLIMNDRVDEARAILIRLHGHSGGEGSGDDYAMSELYQIQKQVAIDRTMDSSWIQMFRRPSYRKRALLAMGTTMIIQCSGVLVINNYGPSIYKNLGFTVEQNLLYPAAWLTFAWGCNFMAMFIVDWFPRPYYMAFGVLGCMATLIVEAALVKNFVPSDNEPALKAAVAMLFVFIGFYSFGLDGTQFAYLGELFPTHLRAKGVCLGVAMISLMNVVWLQAAPTAFEKIGWKFYLAFIVPGTIGGIVMLLVFPDTKGLPLEEIAAIFGDDDEVAVHQADISIDQNTHAIVVHGMNGEEKTVDIEHMETREEAGNVRNV